MAFSCTNSTIQGGWYTRKPFPVPNPRFKAVGTPESLFLYQLQSSNWVSVKNMSSAEDWDWAGSQRRNGFSRMRWRCRDPDWSSDPDSRSWGGHRSRLPWNSQLCRQSRIPIAHLFFRAFAYGKCWFCRKSAPAILTLWKNTTKWLFLIFIENLSFAFAKHHSSSLLAVKARSLPRGEGFRERVTWKDVGGQSPPNVR